MNDAAKYGVVVSLLSACVAGLVFIGYSQRHPVFPPTATPSHGEVGASTPSNGWNVNQQPAVSLLVYDMVTPTWTDAGLPDGGTLDGGSYWVPPTGYTKGVWVSGTNCTALGATTINVDFAGANNVPGLGVNYPVPVECYEGQGLIVTKVYQPPAGTTIQAITQ